MGRTSVRALRLFSSLFVLVILAPGPASSPLAWRSDPCASPVPNAIACENALAGNPASEWDVAGAGSASIQGFATTISVNRGQTIRFKINTPASSYRLDIYRLGYYSGNGARKVATVLPSAALPQAQPACVFDAATGLVDCGVWSESASWLVPAGAVSGVYLAKLVRTDGTPGASHIIFVVRDDEGRSDLLVQTSDTTWQAYNEYGGYSLATSGAAARAYKVSYNRPFTTRGTSPQKWFFHAEYPMLRWLEANGYNVSYSTAVDSDRRGAELLEHQAFLAAGYDEYWSAAQRANIEAARDGGVDLAFFTSKALFWKMRWEASVDGAAAPYRTLVSYQETYANDKIDPLADIWTGTWRDPRFSPPADGGRPENALTGTMFAAVSNVGAAIEVPAELGRFRFWRNTPIAGLAAGQVATLPSGALASEWDEAPEDRTRPSGLTPLSRTRLVVPSRLTDYGSTYDTGPATHSLTLYRQQPGRALVFGAGTAQWSWGLDSAHDGAVVTSDLRMQQATLNLLADMGATAATPRPGLVPPTPADDDAPPSSSIVSPAAGALLSRGMPATIQGTASDAGGAVALVEVSTDGGATWTAAAGTTNWTLQWTPTTAGTVVLKTRAFDDSLNVEVPGPGVSVTVNAPADGACPCTIWNPAVTPPVPDVGADSAVELGVKFRSSTGGYITGVRFFKSAANTGVHVGNLWTSTGTRLATVTFTNETASGWQTASFGSAVPIQPYTTYVVSYYTSVGHYAFSANYFSSVGVDNGPLHALANDFVPNGVFRYGPASAFPNATYLASNYWVDVVFDPNASDTVRPFVAATKPSAGDVAAASADVAVTFSEAVDTATVNASTFELRDSANALVPCSVAHDPGSRKVVLKPSVPLQHLQNYSGRVRGGPSGVKDLEGNALAADHVWSFATGAPPAVSPESGPGGPILVVGSAANPFSLYYAEILRNEGLNAFTVLDIAEVSASTLSAYDLVVLGNITLSSAQATLFTSWVNEGGRLIAMRPDKKLASLLGLSDAAATLRDRYMLIDTATGPGAGLVDQTLQFHGDADLYDLAGAVSIATLYSDAATPTFRPAVALREVGTRGGKAAAFTFDLARSVVYTRQGNPAWAGQERDGTSPIRSTDMFWGGAERDWIDLGKVAIPQADEQQRLFANLILQMNMARRPLPRFWYLPRGAKAAVLMTGDDHGTGGTAARFESFLSASPEGCSVDDWQCVRATSYVYPNGRLNSEDAAAFEDLGFEIALHVNTRCADFTPSALDTFFASQVAQWKTRYAGNRTPATGRTHCIPWSDWSSLASTSLRHGIRLDANYYYWPAVWAANSPGLFTGSGMPMRFAAETGRILDIYQAPTQITDESGQFVPTTIETLLDRALGPEGYYGVFTANMHNDFLVSAGAAAIVEAARSRGVPVVSGRQMVNWLDGRNSSTYRNLAWNGSVLTFTIEVGAGARGLEAMVPAVVNGLRVDRITTGDTPITFARRTIKGMTYAAFAASSAPYRVTYVADSGIDSTALAVHGRVRSASTLAPLANIGVSVFHENGTLVGTIPTDAFGAYRMGVGPGRYYLRTSNQQAYIDQVFSDIACAAICNAFNGTAVEVTGIAPASPADFLLVPITSSLIYPAANAIDVLFTRSFEWTAVPGADAYVLHIGNAPGTWDVLGVGSLTQTSYRLINPLPADRILYARVGARINGIYRWSANVAFRAAPVNASLVYPAANATDVLTTRSFEWTSVAGATAYVLHVGTAPGAWDVLGVGSLTQTAYRVVKTLPSDRTLYARVGALVGGVYRWSANVPFRAAPVTSSLLYPTANAIDVLSTTRNFEWTAVPGADVYVLHIGTTPGAWDVVGVGALTQTSYRVTRTLPSDRTLYARVAARLGGAYRWSEIIPFRAAPVASTMIYPTANATGVLSTRNFEWTAVPGADSYVLHIGTAPGTWDLLGVASLTQTSYRVTRTLPADRTLYARVGARLGGVYRWSENIPFRAAPVTATLVYPTANAVDVLLTRSFEWTTVPGADQYVLYIGTAPGAGDLLGIGGLTQTSYRLTSPLPSDRTLYVRVGARLAGVYKWSEIVPFRAAPVTATVLYPTANATDITITRDFEWTGVLAADAYVLHIGTAPGTWDVLGVGGLTQTAYRVSAALPSDRLLYARVGSRVGGVYRWSATIAFRAASQ